ncbi:MAG: RNA polymerase sigma-70 factor [Rikenellaceae bacterium]
MDSVFDKRCLQRVKRGDQKSFNLLFMTHHMRYRNFAERLVRDADAADDIVQNVFIKLWIRRENIDVKRSVHNFMLVAIRNEVYNYKRQNCFERHQSLDMVNIEDYSSREEEDDSVVVLRAKIAHIIETMPQRRRQIFTLKRFESLSNKEIAERMGISQRTVEKHLEMAIKQLRHSMGIFTVMALIMLVYSYFSSSSLY